MKDEAGGRREERRVKSEEGAKPQAATSENPEPRTPNPESPVPNPQPPTSNQFRLLIDPPSAGSWNMAVDESLLETAAKDGRATLRFYQWREPTLSLGYFQTYEDRLTHAPSAGCPTVRRSSGGGAIMHDKELTYSLAVPEGHPLVVNRMTTYRVVHESLIETLRRWDVEASLYTCIMAAEARESNTSAGREPFLCFQRRATGDVLAGGVKIAGSAQRRCRGAVLQHGSILLARSEAAPELDGLKERSNQSIIADNLIEAWLVILADRLGVEWHHSALSEGEVSRSAELDSEKYATAAWTKNRGRR